LTHIESRPADSQSSHFEFYVDCTGTKQKLDPVLKKLEEKAAEVKVIAGDNEEGIQ
jgi:prephenate dehydratase